MQIDRVNPTFWQGRRVFITGHTGFMGGWLSLWLDRLGAELAGYSLPAPEGPNFFNATGLAKRMQSVTADIRNLQTLQDAMAGFAPDMVLHLAAQPLVGHAWHDPVTTWSTNVMGTVNTLESIRQTPSVKTALIVTTDKVYENAESLDGYREDSPLGGHEAYGASKASAEHAVSAYRQSYFQDDREVGIATIRAGNIIGGGDWAENRLVPDAIRAFSSGEMLSLRFPDAVRPWQHVLDPLRGYLMLGQALWADPASWSGPWNFGPAECDSVPVSHVADRLAQIWGNDACWTPEQRCQDTATPKEARLLYLDSQKAASHLGWKPDWSLDRALSLTVEWHQAHLAAADMAEISHQQIALAEGIN